MARVMRVHRFGGPEALALDNVEDRPPGPGEIVLRHTAIGVNFTDIHARRGEYPELGPPPLSIGQEGVGVVEAVGPGVTRFKPGDRVGYAARPQGSYADRRVFAADRATAIPSDIDDRAAAASLLKGMTVEYLTRRAHAVRQGEWVLFHAAAGGVGTLAVQWLKHLGARIIGTVGTEEKAAAARAGGCDHVFLVGNGEWVEAARDLTGGRGVDAVYDSVGQATWEGSIAALARRGAMVSFGNSSGRVPPVSINLLGERGSLSLTWTRLGDFTATPAELDACAGAVFDGLRRGFLRPKIWRTYPLAEAARAHRDLESRASAGALLLVP